MIPLIYPAEKLVGLVFLTIVDLVIFVVGVLEML